MNNILVKENNDKIAKFMGLTPDSLGFYLGTDIRKLGIPFPQYMGNGTTDLQFHTSYDWLMPVLEKIECDLNYFLLAFPFCDDSRNVIDLFYATFRYDTTDYNEEPYVDVVNCDTRKEAIFRAIGEFLDKYYSQEEKNRRIEEKRAIIKSQISIALSEVWRSLGTRKANNHDEVVGYIYENVFKLDENKEITQEDVRLGLVQWIETSKY